MRSDTLTIAPALRASTSRAGAIPPAARSDTAAPWQWVLGIWSIPTVLGAFASYANAWDGAHPISAGRALWLGMAAWLIWALLTPLIVHLGQRWPLDRRRRWRYGIAHIVAAVAVGVSSTVITAVAVYTPGAGSSLAGFVSSRAMIRAPMGATLYFIVLGVSYLAINTRRLHARELLTERLSRDLADAQLSALRVQLHPHFLFNSLNAVMALVRDQATDRADRALVVLSEVLRTTLGHGARQRIPLADEVAFIRNYLEIETLRFGDRLTVVHSIPEALGDVQVPTFVLQPFVENALQHGLLDLEDGGTLEITAERRGETLVLSVVDDGVGLSDDWEERAQRAVGIVNARERLARMYGSASSVTIGSRADRRGTSVVVVLPLEVRA